MKQIVTSIGGMNKEEEDRAALHTLLYIYFYLSQSIGQAHLDEIF